MKLTNKACQAAKTKDKSYKIFDGGGLYLYVTKQGSKLWRLKYRYLGKEKVFAIGAYPVVTLAEARDARDKAKKLLAQIPPIDPMVQKQETKVEKIRNAENTFKAVALEWLEQNQHRWSANYAGKVRNGLEKNIFPYIGKRPIADIKPTELLESCLRRIERRGSLDIAGRTRQICGQIFRYGIQTGKCEWNAAEQLKGALKVHKKEHFRAMDLKQLPDFIRSLERNEIRLFERTRRAVWLSLYTFCRPVEIRKARWQDIDFEAGTWTIPAEYMKAKRDHIMPLSQQVIDVFKAQKAESGDLNSEWVFPSQVKLRNPMSDGTVNKAIKRLGYGQDMVAHGFRALARTTIHEKLNYPSEVIEKQLAHKSSGPLGEAYDRTQFLDQRKVMMQDWADFIDTFKKVGH